VTFKHTDQRHDIFVVIYLLSAGVIYTA